MIQINSQEELDEAIDTVEKLLEKGDLSDEENEYLDHLTDLIEAYENIHYPIDKSPPKDVLNFIFSQNDHLTNAILAKETNLPEATIEALRNGDRVANDIEAQVLGQRFYLDPSVFQEEQ
jgi:HTH-type transcriptional regulator / antitoxin HigA